MAGRGNILLWEAENIMVSLFVDQPHPRSASSLYQIAYGNEPASSNDVQHPQVGRMGSASSLPRARLMKTLQLQPGRCDLVLHAQPEDTSPTEYPPKISDFLGGLSELVEASGKLVGAVTDVVRLAINVRLAKNFEEITKANAAISEVLPVKFGLEDERDFSLQINKRKVANSVNMNRLIKWTVEPIQYFGSVTGDPSRATIFREFWTAAVHLDFNTVLPRSTFKSDEVLPSLSTLSDTLVQARKNNLIMA